MSNESKQDAIGKTSESAKIKKMGIRLIRILKLNNLRLNINLLPKHNPAVFKKLRLVEGALVVCMSQVCHETYLWPAFTGFDLHTANLWT